MGKCKYLDFKPRPFMVLKISGSMSDVYLLVSTSPVSSSLPFPRIIYSLSPFYRTLSYKPSL